MPKRSMFSFAISENLRYDNLKKRIQEFVENNKPKPVKEKGKEVVIKGFYGFKELDNGIIFRYYRKRYKEIFDPYTSEKIRSTEIITFPILISKSPYIMIMLNSDVRLVNKVLGSLNNVIDENSRTSIEFSQDFIEYCNTASENDPNFNTIFNDDLINIARGGGNEGYKFFEEYADIKERMKKTKVAPRNVAGLKVILADNIVDVKIYPSGKVTFEKITNPEGNLSLIVQVIARLKKAYEDYLSVRQKQ